MEPYLKMRKYEDKNGLQQVQLIYFHNESLKLDTLVRTKSIYWTGLVEGKKSKNNNIRGRVLSRCQEIGQNQNDLNELLKNAENKLNNIIMAFKKKNGFNPDIAYVQEEFYKEKIIAGNDQDIKKQLQLWIPKKAKKVKHVKIYITLLHDLINIGLSKPIEKWKKLSKAEFSELIQNGKPILFRQIDETFKNKYLDFLDKRGCQNPTINKRFEALRTFLNAMYEESINEFTYYQKFKIDRDEVSQEVIIPSPEQFVQLISAQIDNESMDYARSLFVISCLTGLRYSDVMKITESRIREIGKFKYIKLIQKKNGKPVAIPIHPIAQGFLEKYSYNIHQISNQKLNVALKKVFVKLEFNDKVTVYKKYGIKDAVPHDFGKSEIMGFHSGRRFFCSMLVNGHNGFRLNLGNVKVLSGHSSPIIEQYVKEGDKMEEEMFRLFSSFSTPVEEPAEV